LELQPQSLVETQHSVCLQAACLSLLVAVVPGFMRVDPSYCLVGDQIGEDGAWSLHLFSFRVESSMLPPSVKDASRWCSGMTIKLVQGAFCIFIGLNCLDEGTDCAASFRQEIAIMYGFRHLAVCRLIAFTESPLGMYGFKTFEQDALLH
jgi:hypothetical protein